MCLGVCSWRFSVDHQIGRYNLRQQITKPGTNHLKVSALVLIGQMLLIPCNQMIHLVNQGSRHMQCISFRCRSGHDSLSDENGRHTKHFVRQRQLRQTLKHLKRLRANLLGKSRTAQLADDFAANV